MDGRKNRGKKESTEGKRSDWRKVCRRKNQRIGETTYQYQYRRNEEKNGLKEEYKERKADERNKRRLKERNNLRNKRINERMSTQKAESMEAEWKQAHPD